MPPVVQRTHAAIGQQLGNDLAQRPDVTKGCEPVGDPRAVT